MTDDREDVHFGRLIVGVAVGMSSLLIWYIGVRAYAWVSTSNATAEIVAVATQLMWIIAAIIAAVAVCYAVGYVLVDGYLSIKRWTDDG